MAGIRRTAIVPTDQAIGDKMTVQSRNASRRSVGRPPPTVPPAKKRSTASAPKR